MLTADDSVSYTTLLYVLRVTTLRPSSRNFIIKIEKFHFKLVIWRCFFFRTQQNLKP